MFFRLSPFVGKTGAPPVSFPVAGHVVLTGTPACLSGERNRDCRYRLPLSLLCRFFVVFFFISPHTRLHFWLFNGFAEQRRFLAATSVWLSRSLFLSLCQAAPVLLRFYRGEQGSLSSFSNNTESVPSFSEVSTRLHLS